MQFENPTQAQRALQTLNNSQLLGREVALELSHQKPGGERVGKGPAQPTASENCWFCLGSSAADVGLVVSYGVGRGQGVNRYLALKPPSYLPSLPPPPKRLHMSALQKRHT